MNILRSIMVVSITCMLLIGCTQTKPADTPPAPPPTYAGAEFLRGTIGSLATLNSYQPTLVSGYGFVVNLKGTGSPDCPPALRQWLLHEMSKRGFGRSDSGYKQLTPERALASDTTAVVLVHGIIPPGAVANSRFDLLVSALAQTQTTSLADGILYMTELRIGGADLSRPSGSVLARGKGPIFINPFAKTETNTKTDPNSSQRVGRILAGGRALTPEPMQLVTTRPSYRITQHIADRINGRFPPDPDDKQPIAVAKNDTIVAINVIDRYKDNPQRMLDLMSHLYLNPTPQFALQKAEQLAKILSDPANHKYADDVAYVWEGFGKNILSVLRRLYKHDDPVVQFAALQAGTRLQDPRTASHLTAIAKAQRGAISERATAMLGELLLHNTANVRVQRTLRQLLDNDDALVRVAAYDALVKVEDPTIRRFAFGNKMVLAQVRCEKPMIYVTRSGRPRVIVFNDTMAFSRPLMFSIWKNRLMVRNATEQGKIKVFYQKPGAIRPFNSTIPDNVGYFVGVLAHKPDPQAKVESMGFDLSYSNVVAVLNRLSQQRMINAPLVLQQSSLTKQITKQRIAQSAARPETDEKPQPDLAPKPDSGDNPSR